MRALFRELRAIFTKYSNENIATEIVECLKKDGAVYVLYMGQELINELNDTGYIQYLEKWDNLVKLEV